MSHRSDGAPGRSLSGLDLLVALLSAALAGVAVAEVAWLLWRHIPVCAALFEGAGVSPAPSTAAAVACSRWFVRLLPLAVLVLVPVASALAVILGTVGFRTGNWAAILRVASAVLLTVALGGATLSGWLVLAMHATYRDMVAATPAGRSS